MNAYEKDPDVQAESVWRDVELLCKESQEPCGKIPGYVNNYVMKYWWRRNRRETFLCCWPTRSSVLQFHE